MQTPTERVQGVHATPRALTGTISFGLVSVPVRMFSPLRESVERTQRRSGGRRRAKKAS